MYSNIQEKGLFVGKNRTPILYRENDKFIYEGDLGMETNERQTSAKKKLIPAVAMLTASAVMLTTATYAWFTLNKEVEVTGLQMSATAGKSLEISLGEINGTTYTNDAPAKGSESWKSAVVVSDYYDKIGKLKPASSNTGTAIYTIPDNTVYGGGTKVNNDAVVSVAAYKDSAEMILKTGADGETTDIASTDNSGYFIDVPMWIRCSDDAGTTDVKCAVTISDPDATNGSDLTKAVRVAIIPVSNGTSKIAGTDDDKIGKLSLVGSSEMYTSKGDTAIVAGTAGTETKIFGLDNTYYGNGPISKTTSGNYSDALAAITAGSFVVANDGVADTAKNDATNSSVVFTLNGAKDSFTGEAFIARVWIEGESQYCNNATAEQDWNINFHFYIDKGNNDNLT